MATLLAVTYVSGQLGLLFDGPTAAGTPSFSGSDPTVTFSSVSQSGTNGVQISFAATVPALLSTSITTASLDLVFSLPVSGTGNAASAANWSVSTAYPTPDRTHLFFNVSALSVPVEATATQTSSWGNVSSVGTLPGYGQVVFLDGPLPTGSVTVAKSIPIEMRWNPDVDGNPGKRNHWRELNLMFKDAGFSQASATFSTEISPTEAFVPLLGTAHGVPTGSNQPANIRCMVPLDKQRAQRLVLGVSHHDAWRPFKLQGTSVVFEPGSERTSK